MSSARRTGRYLLYGVAVLSTVAALVILWPRQQAVPAIQGAVLPHPKPLPVISLSDHRGRPISRKDFTGDWHLVSYGFTHCPDVCPTLLADLARFHQRLDEANHYTDLKIWFYTIDPERDSIDVLANYLPWFDADFVGLRAPGGQEAQRFERSLGMQVSVSPQPEDYQVAHGFRLYLLDDQGRLRAALAPTRNREGQQFYEPEILLRDYLALRRWAREQS